jgi:CheY-like chemotaxis protein
VESINHAIERGAGLTRQILTFARRQPGEPQLVAPAQVVNDLQRLLVSTVGDEVRLEIETNGNDGRVRIDPGQLEQVIVNLVDNAHDAMPTGGHITIRLGAVTLDALEASAHDAAPGAYLTLAVTDDGAGMSPEVQARLFEPFFTTKPASQGAGLGLATSYGIVHQAGGFFTVDSAPGRGSRFVVHLPQSDGRPTDVPAPAPRAASSGGERCVLLVDDSPALRTSLATALRDQAYRVLVAENGEEAVELARRHPGAIDVLVTDVRMSGMSGIEAARAITVLRPGIRCILVSGFTDVPEEQLPRDLPFLAKPFAPPQLLKLIRDQLAPRTP